MTDIIMPKMSDAMEEGKVLRWIKQRGDLVKKGEPIAEIETDKANVELEATDSGVLQEIKALEDETVPIGTTIAVIGPAEEMAGVKGGAAAPPVEEKPAIPPEPKLEEQPAPPPPKEPTPVEEEEEEGIKASPLARKIARDAGVDLQKIEGTGPGGRIVEADVKRFIEQSGRHQPEKPREEKPAPPTPKPEERPVLPTLTAKEITIGRIWETVGKRMTESKQQAPHFYVTMEVDMEEAIRMRQWMNSNRPEDRQISLNDIIIKASAVALVKHPLVNASYAGENKIKIHDSINIGIAVAIKDGLITPTIRNCDKKSLSAISDEAKDLINRTRNGEIKPDEYSGATFTITNLGMYGVEEFSAIIVPSQAAILATGAAIPQPVALDGKIDIRNRMRITVSADHRVIDGARVAEFMSDLKQALEQPIMLLE